ncbi:hypothetical protein EKO27_g516 [Xylaria grammica]|uniref:COP9 signalosome complex subunit 4 n=1 Tax=Xylaria grammica TaxID=363999 RepID=A0A439DJH6_9PEZI|nr:hypothetical protein EKO27_g516 [Xylaria grammica]
MASPKISELLAEAKGATDQAAAYDSLLENLKSYSTPPTVAADMKAIASSIFSNDLRVVALRSVLERFIAVLRDFTNADLSVDVGQHTLDIIAAQPSATFLDQVASLRELIADAHESNEDFLEAAKVLSEIPLDAAQRKVTNDERVGVWVRIVRNYLEVDDTTSAETYLNKLKNVIFTVRASRTPSASSSALAAPTTTSASRPPCREDERLHTLAMAARCAILAPAGPLRSRALGRLYKDERAVNLDEFGMLEKMFLDRLLAPAEVEKFAQGLAPHQLATTSDGSTVLAKAVVEHNLLGASRLYSNIGFEALGVLLGLDASRAEDTTAKMIEQGRLVGRIDQIEEVIWFEGGEASGEKGSGRAEVKVGKEMRHWDANVQDLAEEVENVTNTLQRECPEFVAATLVV